MFVSLVIRESHFGQIALDFHPGRNSRTTLKLTAVHDVHSQVKCLRLELEFKVNLHNPVVQDCSHLLVNVFLLRDVGAGRGVAWLVFNNTEVVEDLVHVRRAHLWIASVIGINVTDRASCT